MDKNKNNPLRKKKTSAKKFDIEIATHEAYKKWGFLVDDWPNNHSFKKEKKLKRKTL